MGRHSRLCWQPLCRQALASQALAVRDSARSAPVVRQDTVAQDAVAIPDAHGAPAVPLPSKRYRGSSAQRRANSAGTEGVRGLLTAIDAPPLTVLYTTGQTANMQRPAARATIAGVAKEESDMGVKPAYSFMIRARKPKQRLLMDQAADERGSGTFNITPRQYHGVIKGRLNAQVSSSERR
ncbi:predicted protein [Postia placenta Mad-698-R]|uniref:Uncharacterized protein n=1 Tax=Postia placenta MAD-698-R-SB12 TaxID=670580 RepID=A0A1X6N3N5_9APHY|nr:hypothetical protein POSPLADRAFT_1141704 [Postia placenta MAD-698-R-SB12]EED78074.1 predicted protein [Postia placenta Mad-698-R]OSX63130.1 hypothetical protein POSPLADRAFT_1141704 [Postia placenta MAD-698-R-SB12]